MQVLTQVSTQQIRNLLVNAFEGGSNYWYMVEGGFWPAGMTKKDFVAGGKAQPEGDYFHWLELVPTIEGGALLVGTTDDDFSKPVIVNLRALEIGAQVMAEKYPKHFADWMGENDDSITGDVFLQCAMFGEVIYG